MPCPRTQQTDLPACSPHCSFVLCAKQGSCEYHFFKSFGMTRLGKMNPRFTDCEADAPTTTPSRWRRHPNHYVITKGTVWRTSWQLACCVLGQDTRRDASIFMWQIGAGPSSLPIVVAQFDERYANRA